MQVHESAMIGSSPVFRAFRESLLQAAGSTATVLLWGESGTGKALAARELHRASPRAAGPLVEVHLGAVTPTLLESELFGHEPGAFTDARRANAGRFRRAEGGTLVLDDVDLLPREAQVKLLRVLQERVVEPLGSERPVPIDVRVVATSTRELAREAAEGRFREDLFWRLAVVPLQLPPLRSRAADLQELAAGLIARTSRRLGVPERALSPDALERLGAHPWPGNVRELENALERVLALAVPPAGELEAGAIRAEELAFLDEARVGAGQELARAALSLGLGIEEVSRAMMEQALVEQRGNISAAARQVGLTRRAFEYRLSPGAQ